MSKNFAPESRFQNFIITAKDGQSVLRPSIIQKTLEIHQKILDQTASVSDYPSLSKFENKFPGSFNMTSLCFRVAGKCLWSSVLDIFDYDEALIQGLNSETDVLNRINNEAHRFDSLGSPIELNSILGGLEFSSNDETSIVSAKAISLVYLIKNNAIIEAGNEVDPPGQALELKLIDAVLKSGKSDYSEIFLSGQTASSLSEEFGSAIRADLLLFGVGIALIVIYTMLFLGKPFVRVHCRSALGLAAVLTVILATGAGYGVASGIGLFYGSLHQVLPFLLLGIGVDSSFLIVSAFHSTFEGKQSSSIALDERIALALKSAGASITVTSLTDVSAFLIGSLTSLPGLSSFAIYAAMGVLFDFIMSVTFFTACLVIDARRSTAGRMDCLCCIKPKVSKSLTESGNFLKRFFKEKYAPFLLRPITKSIGIMIVVGFAGFSIFAATRLEEEFSFSSFIPDNSYVQNYLADAETYFSNGVDVDIIISDIDVYSNNETMYSIYETVLRQSLKDPPLLESKVTNWHLSFDQSLISSQPTSAAAYYSSLNSWLLGAGSRFSADVAFTDPQNPSLGIEASRFRAKYPQKRVDKSTRQASAMTELRAALETSTNQKATVFPFSFQFLFWEQYNVIGKELLMNLSLSFLAIFLITLILLANIRGSLIVSLSVILTVLDILGVMYLAGASIDSVSVVNLVIAFGLAVDYSAHMTHAFLHVPGPNKSFRIIRTFELVGGPVFNGASSTFCAILVLAFAKSYVFRLFFLQFFCTVCFGLFHAMTLVPILLSLIGPEAVNSQGKPRAQKEEHSIHSLSKSETEMI